MPLSQKNFMIICSIIKNRLNHVKDVVFIMEERMKKVKQWLYFHWLELLVFLIVGAICVGFIFFANSTQSFKRALKSFDSDLSGGLERTVTVYDYNGNKIESWTGKFDVSSSENEVYFDDQNGKRIIIHNGIVINEEK